jgi:hypothetical protein
LRTKSGVGLLVFNGNALGSPDSDKRRQGDEPEKHVEGY